MSEKQEKRRRLNQRLAYVRAFQAWTKRKPPAFLFWRYQKWKAEMPRIESFAGCDTHE